MKETELRIGNYIKTEFGISKVRGTAKEAVWLNSLGGPIRLDGFLGIQPIPLTEDILLKCGFEFADDNHIFWIKGAFNLEKSEDNKFWFEVYDHYNEIKYLHQLQNLYFALTGEELTVNL